MLSKGFLIVGVPKLTGKIFPGIVRIRGADHDLEFRVNLPDSTDGFHAVPPGRHPHVHKRHGIRPPRLQGFANQVKTLLTLQR